MWKLPAAKRCSRTIFLSHDVYKSAVNVTLESNIYPQIDPPPSTKADFDVVLPPYKSERKNVQLQLIESRMWAFYRAKNEPQTLPLSPPKMGGSETRIRYFTSKTWHFLDETLLQSFFALKLYPWCPHRVAQKCNFVHDFANNAAL